MVHQISCTLNASIGQFTDLFWIVAIPSTTVEVPVELEDELGMNEIGEGIAHVARVVMVDGQVQKVDSEFVYFSNLL